MFEAPEETPVVPVGETEELDLDQLTEEERRKFGFEGQTTTPETEETAQ